MHNKEELQSPSSGIKIKYNLQRIITARCAMLVMRNPHTPLGLYRGNWDIHVWSFGLQVRSVVCMSNLTIHLYQSYLYISLMISLNKHCSSGSNDSLKVVLDFYPTARRL